MSIFIVSLGTSYVKDPERRSHSLGAREKEEEREKKKEEEERRRKKKEEREKRRWPAAWPAPPAMGRAVLPATKGRYLRPGPGQLQAATPSTRGRSRPVLPAKHGRYYRWKAGRHLLAAGEKAGPVP